MTFSDESESLIISEAEAGQRLDRILADRYKEIRSRTYFEYLIEEHLVLLNGSPVKKRTKPLVGDEVEIQFALTPEIQVTPEPISLDILYEDEEILVINKAVGMVVHPAPGHWSGTLANALLFHCRNLKVGTNELRPGIVHRLDKDTSGVLVAAKTTESQQALVNLFATRKVYKEYLAICLGYAGDIELNNCIGRHPVHRKLMSVVEQGGKNAITSWETLYFDGKLSVAKVHLKTGRTHQIRVHMKFKGVPILGDSSYGNEQANSKYEAQRQMLHASVLRFEHPSTGKLMEFQAPLPVDMKEIMQKIHHKHDLMLKSKAV